MKREIADYGATEREEKYACFDENFREVTLKLAGAYSIPDEIYGQEASLARFESGESINQAERFLKFVKYDPNIAEEILMDSSLGNLHFKVDEILSSNPDSVVRGRSKTIAVLAQRGARLQALLDPKDGIPDAYATAQGQIRKALVLVERAASLANDWNPSWGTINTDNALVNAKGQVTRKKVAWSAMVGILVLAGCLYPVTPIPINNREVSIPTIIQIVPSKTETAIPSVTIESTIAETSVPTKTAIPEPTEAPTQVEKGETISEVLFPENLKNEGENISFSVSTGAKSIAETYTGSIFNEVDVSPEILSNIKSEYIVRIKELLQSQNIIWNGYVPFINIPVDSISGEGLVHSFNPETCKPYLWDTSKKIHFYTVSKEELEKIYENKIAENPNMFYLDSLGKLGRMFAYTDTTGNGETYIFQSLDYLLLNPRPQYSPSVRTVTAFFTVPISSFDEKVIGIAFKIGKQMNVVINYDYVWSSIGCNIKDTSQECTEIHIK